MKERTSVLFELAEQDLKFATEILFVAPNMAAVHAQECAEKSLKAVLWELSDIQDDELRGKIGHDSIRAVTKVLGQTIIDVSRRSGYDHLESKLRSQKELPGWQLAMLLYYAFSTTFEEPFDSSIPCQFLKPKTIGPTVSTRRLSLVLFSLGSGK